MDLSDGAAKLRNAHKKLLLSWDEAKLHWNDSVRRDFDENQMTPLEREVTFTLAEIGRLDQVLAQARRECT